MSEAVQLQTPRANCIEQSSPLELLGFSSIWGERFQSFGFCLTVLGGFFPDTRCGVFGSRHRSNEDL